jgi:uncharacterized membrane protein YhaH (DUF805 family)
LALEGFGSLVRSVWWLGFLAVGIAALWLLLELLILPGTRGENRFGPDPRAKRVAAP